MRTNSRALLLLACTSFIGGVGCSDDAPIDGPGTDGGSGAATLESSAGESSTSTVRSSTGPVTSDDNSENSASSEQTVVTEDSSTPDASDSATLDATSADSALDGGFDASNSSPAQDAALSSTETSGDASAPPPVEFVSPRGACDLADRVGRFTFEAQSDFGVVQGSVSSGVVPSAVPDVVVDSGDCRLNKRRTLTCLPACVAGETCGEGGECIPFPEPVGVGRVDVTGLTKSTSMAGQAPSFLYFAPGADNPPYVPLSEITLSASGGATPPFHLFGVGSEPLTASPTWVLQENEDFEITWPASDAGAGTTVFVEVTVDQHGASPLSLSCEFADTGNAVVPASMIDQLLTAGISGFPNGRITRRTVDHVDVNLGCIELAVGSPRSASIVVAGHTPCDGPGDCPVGQHCNMAIEQCEDN